jgi:hypothetical protein
VRDAVQNTLSAHEKENILRFSVLTPDEYKTLFAVPHHGKTVKQVAPAAKRMARNKTAPKATAAGAR